MRALLIAEEPATRWAQEGRRPLADLGDGQLHRRRRHPLRLDDVLQPGRVPHSCPCGEPLGRYGRYVRYVRYGLQGGACTVSVGVWAGALSVKR